MEKFNFVFLIREDARWGQVFSHIANLKKESDSIGEIAVVAVGTSILSCLKSARTDALKSKIISMSAENVRFYLCTNTMYHYGIVQDMIVPEFEIAHEGGLLKVARLEALGYHLVALG